MTSIIRYMASSVHEVAMRLKSRQRNDILAKSTLSLSQRSKFVSVNEKLWCTIDDG